MANRNKTEISLTTDSHKIIMKKNVYIRIKELFLPDKNQNHKKVQYITHVRNDAAINIVFFLPVTTYPSGGVIVAHDHSDAINEIESDKVHSTVLYPMDLNFLPKLFLHNSRFKRNYKFDLNKDFVILPEVMVVRFAPELIQKGIKYAIHVQNGYLMDFQLDSREGSFERLHKAYQNASIIIGNSIDTIKNIEFVFPDCKEKVIRSYFVIDKHKYKAVSDKKNIITYMPRKLSKHSKHVLFFLSNKIPANWKIVPIDGVTEQEVYNIFFESKIFLSFSEFEGLAMPPAMAAMSGNKVIGYTGEANKEYFHLPCFEEIPCGDIKLFASKVLETIQQFDNGKITLDMQSIEYLEQLFSKTKQTAFIKNLISHVADYLQD